MIDPAAPARRRAKATALLAVIASLALSACVPALFAVGVGAGALVATDRRSAGAQVDDEAIELKIAGNATQRWGDRAHLNVTSFNGLVLLTGEAPTPDVQDEISATARSTPRVRSVQNEMVVGPVTDLGARTTDTYITSKVKTRLVDAQKVSPTHVKVVTERGVVYLMGIVTRDEAAAASAVAATTSGVARVVKVFEYTN
jgi:osmotically-inducible protein OsmY